MRSSASKALAWWKRRCTPALKSLRCSSAIRDRATCGPSLALIPNGARILSTTDRLFAQISGTEAPQGIAALLRPHVATFDDLVRGTPLIVIMAGLQDPGNVGALIRTAEAFGATGVAASIAGGAGTANPFGPKALRASAGSALRLPILRGIAAPVLLAQLRVAGVRVYAACPDDVRSDPGRMLAAHRASLSLPGMSIGARPPRF